MNIENRWEEDLFVDRLRLEDEEKSVWLQDFWFEKLSNLEYHSLRW